MAMLMLKSNKYITAVTFSYLLVLYEIVAYFSNDAYLPALPNITNEFNTTYSVIQITIVAWFTGSASIQLLLGPMIDYVGRRPVLLAGTIVFVISTLACAITTNISLFIIFRFVQGTTIPTMLVAGYATIHDSFDRETAIKVLARMNGFIILAPAIGPLFGSFILLFGEWHLIFYTLSIAGLFILIGLYMKMPETAVNRWVKFSVSDVAKQYKNILLTKQFILYLITTRCLFACLIGWITVGPFLLINSFHFNNFEFGIAQAVVFGSFILGTRIVSFLISEKNMKKLIHTGTLLATIGGLYAILASILAPTVVLNIIIGMILVAFGSGLVFPILNRIGIEASNQPMSAKVAISSFLMCLAGIIGSSLATITYSGTILSFASLIFMLTITANIVILYGLKISPLTERFSYKL